MKLPEEVSKKIKGMNGDLEALEVIVLDCVYQCEQINRFTNLQSKDAYKCADAIARQILKRYGLDR